MLPQPLIFQVQSSSNTAKAALTRLADMENVAMEDDEKTYPQLFERVKKTIDALKTLKPESMEGKEEAEVVIKIPNAELKFNCITYLQKFGRFCSVVKSECHASWKADCVLQVCPTSSSTSLRHIIF